MPKKKKRVSKKRAKKTTQPSEAQLIMIRSWMLIVVFALMLGIGAIVGTFFRMQLEGTAPQVAGAQVELR